MMATLSLSRFPVFFPLKSHTWSTDLYSHVAAALRQTNSLDPTKAAEKQGGE
jgi:hypothetical protein